MAQYEHLPIYRKAFDLAVYLERTVHGFSRHHKYGLGVRLQHGAQDVLTRVIRAQNTDAAGGRAAQLAELRVELEVLKNLLHLAKEVQAFKSFNAYGHAADLAVSIGRQTEGWLKTTVALRAPESRPTNPEGSRS
jgi:hypothetical protein